jgi:hypothetical protein
VNARQGSYRLARMGYDKVSKAMPHAPARSMSRKRPKPPTHAEFLEIRAQVHDLFRLTGDNMDAIATLRKVVDDLKRASVSRWARPISPTKARE